MALDLRPPLPPPLDQPPLDQRRTAACVLADGRSLQPYQKARVSGQIISRFGTVSALLLEPFFYLLAAMQHADNLDAIRLGPVEDDVIADRAAA
jgi:hypothetical protein